VEDLDDPGLARALCSPLARRENPDLDDYFDWRPYLPYQYDGRFGLTTEGSRWVLDECGRPGSRALPEGIVSASLVAGRVTWVDRGRVVVYDARTRRTLSWRIRSIDPDADGAVPRLTRTRLFVATFRRSGEASGARVFSARLPESL
jgi:hypothetical protein